MYVSFRRFGVGGAKFIAARVSRWRDRGMLGLDSVLEEIDMNSHFGMWTYCALGLAAEGLRWAAMEG